MKRKTHSNRPDPRRRQLLAGLAGSLALSACGGRDDQPATAAPALGTVPPDRAGLPRPALPDPATSGIDHIVMVTMENRSFDHFLGWVPGAEGLPAGNRYHDAFGQPQVPFALAANAAYGYQACAFADPNHAYDAGRTHLDGGKMDGFLLTPGTSLTRGDLLPIGYYGQSDLDFCRGLASQFTVCDYYMSGLLADTFPNRVYLHSGETDRLGDTLDVSSLPTIWDRLDAKSIDSAYYFHDVPFTALYGTRYVGRSRLVAEFFTKAATGTLPPFCMVDPRFGGEDAGGSNDDHPHADVRNGQVLLGQIYEALRTSPAWSKTLLIIVYDEWGGFVEHVVPPVRPVSAAEQALGNDGRLGFRVPCMLAGPRVRANYVSRFPFDPSSIHQLLAWRFGLDPLGVRGSDAGTVNLAYALDLQDAPRPDAPAIPVAQGAFGTQCGTSVASIVTGIGQLDSKNAAAGRGGGASGAAGAASGTGAAGSASAASATSADEPGGRFADLRAKAITLGFPVGP